MFELPILPPHHPRAAPSIAPPAFARGTSHRCERVEGLSQTGENPFQGAHEFLLRAIDVEFGITFSDVAGFVRATIGGRKDLGR